MHKRNNLHFVGVDHYTKTGLITLIERSQSGLNLIFVDELFIRTHCLCHIKTGIHSINDYAFIVLSNRKSLIYNSLCTDMDLQSIAKRILKIAAGLPPIQCWLCGVQHSLKSHERNIILNLKQRSASSAAWKLNTNVKTFHSRVNALQKKLGFASRFDFKLWCAMN